MGLGCRMKVGRRTGRFLRFINVFGNEYRRSASLPAQFGGELKLYG